MEEDEWEYEYDEAETEDFYITVDLSNVPEIGAARASGGANPSQLVGHPILLRSRLRALYAARKPPLQDNPIDSETSGDQSSVGRMQMTGLETPNPLILYNDRLLSCHWGATIGTDMFFVKPNNDATSKDQPLRTLERVDLLATSSSKLMAKEAHMRPHSRVTENTMAESPKDSGEHVHQPGPPNRFLARLNELKIKRGEKTLLVPNPYESHRVVASENQAAQNGRGSDLGAEDVEMGGVDSD